MTKNSSAGDNSQIHCEAKILIIAEKFSNSQILDKKKICEICGICVTKKKGGDYEEAKDHRAGGEGDSSRTHSIPHGDQYDQLYGRRTVLRRVMRCIKKRPASASLFLFLLTSLPL